MCVYNKTKKNLPSIPTWSLYLGNSIDNLNKPAATRQFIFYLKDKRNLYLKRIIFRHRDEFRNYVQDTWSRRQKNDPSVSHDAALKVWDDTKMSRTLVKVLFLYIMYFCQTLPWLNYLDRSEVAPSMMLHERHSNTRMEVRSIALPRCQVYHQWWSD